VTLLLSRSVMTSALDVGTVLALLSEGFKAAPMELTPLRVRCDLPGPGTATCLMPGLLPGIPAYTVKVNAKFPDATPALRGVPAQRRKRGVACAGGLRDRHSMAYRSFRSPSHSLAR
jgi:hypothetical protein